MPPSLIEPHRRSMYGVLQSSEAVLLKATSIIPRPVTPAFLTKPQLCPDVNDTSLEWDVREFIGKEYVDVLHYIVERCPTLEPVHSLEHAKELVDEFEARLPALRKDKKGRVGPARGSKSLRRFDEMSLGSPTLVLPRLPTPPLLCVCGEIST
jgi:hypothetical protein